MNDKYKLGEEARAHWAKDTNRPTMFLNDYNLLCNNVFVKYADLVLDERDKPQTAVKAIPDDETLWKEDSEIIYLFVEDGMIMKIGGTRNSMKERWGSYLCGFHVAERNRSGKCSVTNAHVYHTIEKNLLDGHLWEIWCWKLPRLEQTVNILGKDVTIIAQTYHAYETVCIEKFKEHVNTIPVLCMNSDPAYKK